MSRKDTIARREDVPKEAPAGKARPALPPRPLIAVSLGIAAVAIGLVPALLQPWDPAATGAEGRTPPDETAHVVYVDYLVESRSLPALTSGAGLYEAHQPPLYYLSAIPARQIGLALDPPADTSTGPTNGEVLALRIWSVLIAAGVVVACYLVACAVFPASLLKQVAVPVFVLLLPGHTINLAAVTNDGLAELFCCLAIWVSLGIVRAPTAPLSRFGMLGAVIGLALLTKTSCLFLVPVALVALLAACSPLGPASLSWRQFGIRAALLLAVVVGLWGPWIIRNLAVYPGDPLVTRTFVEVFGRDRATPETFLALGLSFAGYLRLVITWTYLSFWGVFGQAAVFMSDWYYALGSVVAAIAAVGIGSNLLRWRAAARESKAVWSLLILGGILIALQFLRFNMAFFQAQARYLFPAIAPIGCAFVAGIDRTGALLAGRAGSAEKWRLWVIGILGALLVAMLLAALLAVASDAAPAPPPPWIGLPRLG